VRHRFEKRIEMGGGQTLQQIASWGTGSPRASSTTPRASPCARTRQHYCFCESAAERTLPSAVHLALRDHDHVGLPLSFCLDLVSSTS